MQRNSLLNTSLDYVKTIAAMFTLKAISYTRHGSRRSEFSSACHVLFETSVYVMINNNEILVSGCLKSLG